MLYFLNNFNPSPLMFSWGFLKIYWYGFFIVLGIVLAFFITLFLAKKYNIKKDTVIDLFFYLIVFGIIGARIYDVFLEWQYYIKHPIDIFKIWQGGLAIHGAIIAGLIYLYLFVKKSNLKIFENLNNWQKLFSLTAILAPGLALGQAIGRWGNYFNQELFGRPTNLSWGIFIDVFNRPIEYLSFSHFHPTFLYESIGCLIIFFILMILHLSIIRKNNYKFKNYFLITFLYLLLYSILRLSLEFIRIDFAPEILGLRLPQFISIITILILIIIFPKFYFKN